MGLFDSYQFNPDGYGGGLLGRLGMNAPLAMYGAKPELQQTGTMPYGGQQVPVFGQPDQASIPPNAQLTQAQAPQQQSPGLGGSLMAGFQGFAEGGRTGGFLGALAGGASGLSRGETRENMTLRALMNAGMDKDTATVVASDPNLLRAVMPQMMGTAGKTDDIKEFEYAKRQGFKGSLEEWMQRKRSGAGEFSLTPVYGTNEKGETVLLQPGKSGSAIETKLPPGVKISSGVEKIDLGTQWGLYDKRTGNLVGYQPKDLRGAEREKDLGTQQGKELAAAPGDIRASENALELIDKIKKSPNISWGTGLASLGNFIPGTPGKDFENLVQGAKSGAFLQAIQQMRGLGSLSNAEGDAATRAISRMDTATSKEAFLDAINDYEKIVRQGNARAKARLANPSATNPSAMPAAKPTGKTSSGLQWSVE